MHKQHSKRRQRRVIKKMVPGARLELARPEGRGILSPLRLPNSATRAYERLMVILQTINKAEVGIEPAYTALQAAA